MKHARLLTTFAALTFTSLSVAACAPDPVDDSPAEDSTSAAASVEGCRITRAQIEASVSGSRRTMLTRAFRWYDVRVPYSQSRSFEGYRTDCSGFVSMAWQLPRSYTTYNFTAGDYNGDTKPITELPNLDALTPGDALAYRSGNKGHAVIFLGWNDDGHTSACLLEQLNPQRDVVFGTRRRSELTDVGYTPFRARSLD